MRGFATLGECGITCGALAVITAAHLSRAREFVRFYIDAGFSSLGLNVEEVENAHKVSSLHTKSVLSLDTERRFVLFVEELFDEWWPSRGAFDIREFQDFFNATHRKLSESGYERAPDEAVAMGILTVHKGGAISTYSPEFAGAKDARFSDFIVGDVWTPVDEVSTDQRFSIIAAEVEKHRTACRQECHWFALCGGAFVSNVYFESGGFARSESTACRLLRKRVADVLIRQLGNRQMASISGSP